MALHGLSANARCLDAIAFPGACVLPDFRGRGQSDQPESGYTLAEHALDIVPLCGPEGTVVVGHSFGGLVGLYLAAHHPECVTRLVLLDSAVGVIGPGTLATIGPSLERLRRRYASFEEYLETARVAGWPAEATGFFEADTVVSADGSCRCRTRPETIQQVMEAASAQDWAAVARAVTCPVRLVRASEGIVGAESLALTRECIPGLEVVEVPGNHFSMLYGPGARAIAEAL